MTRTKTIAIIAAIAAVAASVFSIYNLNAGQGIFSINPSTTSQNSFTSSRSGSLHMTDASSKFVIGFGLFGAAAANVPMLASTFENHGLAAPDYGANFRAHVLQSYPESMDKHLLFYTVTLDVKNGLRDAIEQATANGGASKGWSVAYDDEPHNGALSTPPTEYNGTIFDKSTGKEVSLSAFYANLAADQAHAAGLQFGITPASSLYMGQKYPSILDGVAWNKVDYWMIQVSSGSGGSQNIIDAVDSYAKAAKTENPGLRVCVSINESTSAPNMPVSEVTNVLKAISDKVDGIEFHRYNDAETVQAMLTAAGR